MKDLMNRKAWVIVHPSGENEEKSIGRQSKNVNGGVGIKTKIPAELEKIEPSVYTKQWLGKSEQIYELKTLFTNLEGEKRRTSIKRPRKKELIELLKGLKGIS